MKDEENKKGSRIRMRKKDSEVQDSLTDKSAYGEFVPTFHGWASSEEQIKSAERIYKSTGKKRG